MKRKSFIRDDRLPMHASHVQLFDDFARGNAGNRKILIFGHVLIFYIENNIEKHFSYKETYTSKARPSNAYGIELYIR